MSFTFMSFLRHTPVRVHSKAAVKLSNVEASIIWVSNDEICKFMK